MAEAATPVLGLCSTVKYCGHKFTVMAITKSAVTISNPTRTIDVELYKALKHFIVCN